MTTVYACIVGVYSDYHINAMFSTLELAEAYNQWYGCPFGGVPRVEAWELDQIPQMMRDGTHGYQLWMWRDGDSEVDVLSDKVPFATEYSIERAKKGEGWEHELYMRVVATSEQHAVKIANEVRTRLIANNEWPEVGQ